MTQEESKRPHVPVRQTDEELRKKQLEILDLFGTVDFDPAYDYKEERRRRKTVIFDDDA